MKQRMWKLLLALLLVLLLPVSVLLTGASLPSFYGESYYAVLPRMCQRLEQVQGKKVVVIGGSNVAFGLDSLLLESILAEQGYAYTVCPFGLYAAVGTGAMLDLSLDTLNAGDIVILAIEPTSETMSEYFGAEAFWKCAEDAPELVARLSPEKQGMLAGTYLSYLQQRLEIKRSGQLPVAQGVYGAASFDDRCDLDYDRPGNLMPVGFDSAVTVELAQVQISPVFSQQLREYCARAERRGAAVLLSFSPVNRSCIGDLSEASVEAFFNTCNQAFACPVISDPNRYILESGWFYDSNFHLNNAGAHLRTCLLAEDLLTYLGCYRELNLEIPPMPEPLSRVPEESGEEECFAFQSAAGGVGYLVSGLTEEGRSRTTLRIPPSHEGKPVIGLTPDALKDAGLLEQLRIPESVESLPGGLFRNTESLTRLVLEHTSAPCAISEDTFLGADQIRVYVPGEVYPMYRDGYGCENNLWMKYLDRIFQF
ncbi:MAG: hypothetical protein IJ960_09280 [Oscillospiraceae bacterium]|nr:hypothetical protein [Oscillospiraceae bacterium]